MDLDLKQKTMNTLQMEIALMNECNIRQNLVVPNVSYGIVRYLGTHPNRSYDELHECDILKVTPSGYATEYEIKISRSDFKADKKKKHNHNSRFIKHLYYAVPYEMLEFAKENLPPKAGLVYVKDNKVHYVVNAPERIGCFKWTDKEILKLAKLGAMRIYNLKRNINKFSK